MGLSLAGLAASAASSTSNLLGGLFGGSKWDASCPGHPDHPDQVQARINTNLQLHRDEGMTEAEYETVYLPNKYKTEPHRAPLYPTKLYSSAAEEEYYVNKAKQSAAGAPGAAGGGGVLSFAGGSSGLILPLTIAAGIGILFMLLARRPGR